MDSDSESDVEFLFSTKPNSAQMSVKTLESQIESINKSLEIIKDIGKYKEPLTVSQIILKINQSLDTSIYDTALAVLVKHGIGGCRLKLNDFMVEICETLVSILYRRLPNTHRSLYSRYIKEHIPNIAKQFLKTPFTQLNDTQFIVKLFRGEEIAIMNDCHNWDQLYKAAVYISNEKLPQNFQFAPEMPAISGWTPIEDFIAITAAPFLDDIFKIADDTKLPFHKIKKYCPTLSDYISQRIVFIVRELSRVISPDYSIYNNVNGKLIPKQLGDIEQFKRLNSHVIYPKKLSTQMQKKILRIIYLYGIPRKNAVKKIKTFLRCDCITDDLILIFIIQILFRSCKYHYNLMSIICKLPKIIIQSSQIKKIVDIDWISEDAIKVVADHIDLIDSVRENLEFVNGIKEKIELNGIPEWIEIKKNCTGWNSSGDLVLFKLTAYYGFMFNSCFSAYIRLFDIKEDEIYEWREKEVFDLNPVVHPKSAFLRDVFSIENREKRIKQILDHIQNKKKQK